MNARKKKPIRDGSAAPHHLKALDGVRGIAIILVILFHSLLLSIGWVGVQLFFVLSGFLITSILLSDADLPLGFYLKRFYWRRTLRIFPLYYGALAAMTVVYLVTAHPESFGKQWPYLFTYTLNYRKGFSFETDMYFGHFWSLALEEQFYLLWPMLVYLLPPKKFRVVVLAIIAASPLIRGLTAHFLMPVLHQSDRVGIAIYCVTFCQLDAFATGAAVVLFVRQRWLRPGLIAIGCALLFLVCGQASSFLATGRLTLNTSFGYPPGLMRGGQYIWGYTLFNFCSAAMILVALSRNWFSTLLSHPALTYVGKVSYGMYIFHRLVLVVTIKLAGDHVRRHSLANLVVLVCYFSALLLLCSLSYRFYESRFLALKDKRYRREQVKSLLPGPEPQGISMEGAT